ncbi:MAG TPA: cytosine permease [Solirubrobacteraceae bacterium]|jgi:purine-cytosine permease-like protein|nr:cytosine permease [Solirubrobacteraceae bacterium]
MTEPNADQVGHVEVRGVEVIPDSDRHGRPRELFSVWLTSNITVLYIIFGGALVASGLNLLQAAVIIVAGNLAYSLIGWAATVGPAAGTSTLMVSRAHYGPNGNRLSAFFSWLSLVGFEAINIAFGALALFSLAGELGWHVGGFGKALLLAVTVLVTYTVAVLGHATIVRFQQLFAITLGVLSVLLIIFVARHVHWNYAPKTALTGTALWVALSSGLTLILSGPLSWAPAPVDYARYLPRGASRRAIAFYTTLGSLIPSITLALVGAAAATVVDPAALPNSIKAIVPGWFYPLFLAVVVVGTIANNVLGIYSSGLSLQAMGLRVHRAAAVSIDAVIGTAMAMYAIFISDFTTTLTEFLQWALFWWAPYLAIFIVDLLLRRGRYLGPELEHAKGGRYWFDGGYRWRGMVALILGMVVTALFAQTTHLKGPLSTHLLSRGDISALIGMVVGGGLYWILCRTQPDPGAQPSDELLRYEPVPPAPAQARA